MKRKRGANLWSPLGHVCAALLVLSSIRAVLSTADELPVKVGLLTELSGPMASNGENCRQGFEIARHTLAPGDTLGGRRLNFIYADSQGDGKVGLTEFKRLVEQEHVIAVALNRSAVGMAVNPASKQYRVPLFAAIGHSDLIKQNPHAFRFWPAALYEGRAFADYIISRGVRTLVVLSFEDEWTQSFAESFKRRFLERHGRIVMEQNIAGGGEEAGALSSRIKAANADAMLLNFLTPQYGIVLRRLREKGVGLPIYSNYWVAAQDSLSAAGSAAEGVIYDTPHTGAGEFRRLRRELFGREDLSGMATTCYFALAGLLQSFPALPARVDSEAIFNRALQLNSLDLVDGPLEMENREAQVALQFMTIKNGKSQPLE